MANTQTVIIDFQADFSGVQDAVDVLEKAGKVDADLAATFRKTNTEIQKQGQALKTTSQQGQASTQNFTKLSQLMQAFPKSGMNRFLLQVGNELAAAGVKAEDFFNKTTTGAKSSEGATVSLRQELKLVKDQMQQAALSGGVLSEEYKKLKARAGQLDDTIKDVSKDIANAGSDTRSIDNVVGSISALAGGFSAVQGAAALFGDDSENLQKALLRVNAAMALATGLQQVSNALTKQGSLARLAEAAATGIQTAAQKLYTFVVGESTGALKVFKIALASTGIGLLIVGLGLLISKFSGASSAAKQLKTDLDNLRTGTDNAIQAIQDQGDITNALLEEQGVKASRLTKEQIELNKEKQAAEEEGLQKLFVKQTDLRNNLRKGSIQDISDRIKGIEEVGTAIDVSEKNIRALRKQTQLDAIKLRTTEKDEAKKDAEEKDRLAKESLDRQKQLNIKAREDAAKQRALGFEDFKAGVEVELLAAEDGSRKQLELQKKLLNAKLFIDLEAEGISQNQKILLVQTFFKERLELEKKFNKDSVAAGLTDEKNRLDAQLQNLNLSEEDRLAIKINFLQLGAAEEIQAAEHNAAKIKLINAKLNADISAAKVESIKQSSAQEEALISATGGSSRRALEAVSSNEKMKSDIRINAINQLSVIETSAIDRQIQANRDADKIIGADHTALNIEYEQLLDQKALATENTEKKITDITLAENKARQESNIAYIQATIAGLQSLSDIVAGIQSNQQEVANQAIAQQKKELQDAIEAGAITEKEAKVRAKRIEAEERANKQKAAQQQKALAVFNAFLAIPQAFIAGLTAPFPIGGPIYGAILAGLASAQAGIIASRPVPKFASGKKGSYKGLAEVGEVGAELIQRADGSMEVAANRQLVYLGSQDKVFTHSETKNIMPFVNREAMKPVNGKEFDYAKLAKAVKGSTNGGTSINIDKEFISESVADGLSRVNYFNRYYSSK